MFREEAALLRQGIAKVRDDAQESSIRRTRRDESAPQDKVLYPSQDVSVNSAFTHRKTCVYPGRSPVCRIVRLRTGQSVLTAQEKSAEGIVAGGNEPGLP